MPLTKHESCQTEIDYDDIIGPIANNAGARIMSLHALVAVLVQNCILFTIDRSIKSDAKQFVIRIMVETDKRNEYNHKLIYKMVAMYDMTNSKLLCCTNEIESMINDAVKASRPRTPVCQGL